MSNNYLSFLTSYFLTIPVIVALLPPYSDLCFRGRMPLTPPVAPPSTTIVYISASLQLKEEGDLQREEKDGILMGLSVGGRGVT